MFKKFLVLYSIEFISVYLITTMLLSIFAINSFRRFILIFRIFGKPKKRDFHKTPVPNSAGIVFLFLFLIGCIPIVTYIKDLRSFFYLTICMIILTVVGFWDDLKIMSAKRKLVYEILIIISAVLADNLVITNLNGFLGLYEIPLWIGFALTVFIGVFMINSFNLIDGIDGLSGFISIIAFTSFAVIFWVLDYKACFGICILMIGIILAYLPFNFSNKRKVFMGDSGALFIGFLLFIMTMMVVTSDEPIIHRLIHKSILPIAPMTIFLYPMVDTASIYMHRLTLGQSPFVPDRWHTHHLILRLTNSHLMSSILISAMSLLIVALFSYLAFWMSAFNFIALFFGVFLSLIFAVSYLRVYLKRQERNEFYKKNPYSSV